MNFPWVRRERKPGAGLPAGKPRLIAGLLLLLALCGGIWLIRADKPWERGVEAREAKGLAPRVQDYAISGLWKAGLLNTALLAALGLTAGIWAAGTGAGIVEIEKPGELGSTQARILWALLLTGAMGFALAERLPRMSQSLWNDEAYSLRRYVWGCERPAAGGPSGGALEFDAVTWRETFFFNRGANNHILFSICSKLSLGAWSALSKAPEGRFSEAAFRMPSLIAGLLSIAALAWLGAVNGAPWAGLGASWLAAFHPWHLRYSTEGRGYALLLLFLTLAMILLTLAVRRDRLRWWLGFALCQTLFMLSFPGAVYDAAALFAAAVAMILWRRGVTGGWRPLSRLLVAEIVSAMAFLQIYAPSIPQVRLYLERDIARGSMGWDWVKDIWAHLACALQWATPGAPGTHRGIGLSDMAASQPLAFWFLAAVLPCVTLAGIVRAWRRRFELGALAATGLAAPALAFLHTSLTGNFLFSWYLIFSLPVLCLVWACAALPNRAPSAAAIRWPGAILGCAVVAAFLAATAEPRRLIKEIPRQPMREAAAFVLAEAGSQSEQVLTAAAGTSAGQMAVYDPHAVVADSEEELREIQRQAGKSGRTLFVYAAGLEKMRAVSPGAAELLERSGLFKPAARLMGLEEMFSYTIFRHDPRAAKEGGSL